MKYTALILLAAFIITPFVIQGCGSWSLDDPKIVELEARLSKLEGQYNTLVDVNRVLIKERDEYKSDAHRFHKENQDLTSQLAAAQSIGQGLDERLAMAYLVIKEQDKQIAELVIKQPAIKVSKLSFQINFEHGKLYNKKESRSVAQKVLAFAAKHNGKVKITVEGYSSKAGKASINKWFSKERAEGVMHKIYEAHNNGDLSIDVIAHGETDDNERKVIVTVEVL
jgi:outer membrane protein OmpA-like peptidoglycan-associated protein